MAAMPEARLSTVAPGRCQLSGELDFATAPALWRQGDQILGAQVGGAVEVDLSGVTHSDSAGLALLVAWQSQAQAAGVALRYAALPDRLVAIAKISRVESLLVG